MGTQTNQEATTMRKIEADMLKAIHTRTNFVKDNTRVEITGSCANIYLHGNHIATVNRFGIVDVNTNTLLEYPTHTTLSRLRALGVNVSVRKGEVILNGEPLSY